ncbi:MAG TPA: ATP-dependent helicase, partial [Acidimicrobiales bacterium]|nr:ATP-dependent helicase [Acidimicrobiales bacterium]
LRVAHRIRCGSADADHTVVCTFTRKAAAELRDRLAAYGVPVSTTGPGRVPTPGVRVGTLHQLARNLIRRHCVDTGRTVPIVVDQRAVMLRQLTDGPGAAAALAVEIGWAKARGLSPDSYEQAVAECHRHAPLPADEVAHGFRAYQAALDRRGGLDLDDLLVRSAELLATDVSFAERMRWRYRHLAVDEFQDVNPAQFRLLTSLLGQSRDLCVVGDPHQAIYGWNGADPTLLARISDLIGPLATLELTENHRSTPQIVATAEAVLGEDRAYRARSVAADGPVPRVTAYDDEWAEADGVADVLLSHHDAGVPWSEQAVLARTNDQLSVIARVLGRWGIPHRVHAVPGDGADPPRPDGEAEVNAVTDHGSGPTTEAVELTTFHRAKGAEWTSVCVTGIEDGLVPVVHAVDDAARSEEQRLLYVALTRPARFLACSWARRRTTAGGRVVERQPSPWLPGVGAGTSPTPRDRSEPSGSGPSESEPSRPVATEPGPTERERAADRIAELRGALHGER